MPRYKDSPEVRAAKKERREKLREFLSLLDAEDMSDLRSVFKEMVEKSSKTDLRQNSTTSLATAGTITATRRPKTAATDTAGKP